MPDRVISFVIICLALIGVRLGFSAIDAILSALALIIGLLLRIEEKIDLYEDDEDDEPEKEEMPVEDPSKVSVKKVA